MIHLAIPECFVLSDLLSLLLAFGSAGLVLRGHCDTTGGPIIPEARMALERCDVTPVLKWVAPADEGTIRDLFARVVAARSAGGASLELADRFFLETLIRLHRAAEGEPFTGIKDAPVDPIVALADRSLETGQAAELLGGLTRHLEEELSRRFRKAVAARAHRDDSVHAGRDYVEAYVSFVHFVESIHKAIAGTSGHHHAG